MLMGLTLLLFKFLLLRYCFHVGAVPLSTNHRIKRTLNPLG